MPDCYINLISTIDADEDGSIDSTDGINDMAETLTDEGVIDEQMENSLLFKIDNASQSATKDNICAAINQLEALINQVNAQRGKKITDEAANDVIAYTQSVIDRYLDQLPDGESCWAYFEVITWIGEAGSEMALPPFLQSNILDTSHLP